jgi:hypothetical protein
MQRILLLCDSSSENLGFTLHCSNIEKATRNRSVLRTIVEILVYFGGSSLAAKTKTVEKANCVSWDKRKINKICLLS